MSDGILTIRIIKEDYCEDFDYSVDTDNGLPLWIKLVWVSELVRIYSNLCSPFNNILVCFKSSMLRRIPDKEFDQLLFEARFGEK